MRIDVSKVKVFRTVAGEEFIGNLIQDQGDTLLLSRVFKVIHVVNNDGTATIALLRLTMLSDEEWTTFNKSHILCIMQPNKEAFEYYGLAFRRAFEEMKQEETDQEKAMREYDEIKAIAEEENDEVDPGEDKSSEEKEEKPKKKNHKHKKPLVN